MKQCIKNFFDKYLFIGTTIFFISICYCSYLSNFICTVVLLSVFICLILSIKNNIKLYNSFYKIFYLLTFFTYCLTIFIITLLIGLLFFTDLSKI